MPGDPVLPSEPSDQVEPLGHQLLVEEPVADPVPVGPSALAPPAQMPAPPFDADPVTGPPPAVWADPPPDPPDPSGFFDAGEAPEPSWEPSRVSPVLIVGVVFILIGLVLGMLALWVDGGDRAAAPAATTTAATSPSSVASTVPPTTAPTTTVPATTAAPTTAAPTTVPPVPLTGLPVEVLNGAGIQGIAGVATTRALAAGATVTQTTNADSFDHATTVIAYGDPAHAGAATELQTALGGGQLEEDPTLVGDGVAITVIIGEDWPG